MTRYTLDTQQFPAAMVPADDGEWVKADDLESIRNRALEFAARECEDIGTSYLDDQIAEECAAAIRLFITVPKDPTP